MTAREMFEDIGYEFRDHHFLDTQKTLGVMIPQDEPKLIYIGKAESYETRIEFRAYAKVVEVSVTYNANDRRYRIPAPLNYFEIKAIMKQFEELGWESA